MFRINVTFDQGHYYGENSKRVQTPSEKTIVKIHNEPIFTAFEIN